MRPRQPRHIAAFIDAATLVTPLPPCHAILRCLLPCYRLRAPFSIPFTPLFSHYATPHCHCYYATCLFSHFHDDIEIAATCRHCRHVIIELRASAITLRRRYADTLRFHIRHTPRFYATPLDIATPRHADARDDAVGCHMLTLFTLIRHTIRHMSYAADASYAIDDSHYAAATYDAERYTYLVTPHTIAAIDATYEITT